MCNLHIMRYRAYECSVARRSSATFVTMTRTYRA